MDVIQSSNKQVDKFGVGLHGFAPGNPTLGVLATYFSNDWADAVQQELINTILAAGLAKSGADLTQLLKAIRSNALISASDTGGANAAAIAFTPAIGALTENMVLWFNAAATNTGPATLNVNGLGAKAIVGGAHAPLQGGEILANGRCCVVWHSGLNAFVLIECTGASLQVGPATKSQHALQLGQAVGRYLNTQVFTATGTYTPTAGTTKIRVRLVGGGGSGSGTPANTASVVTAGGGGGAGSYAEAIYTSGFSGVTVTIGAGGAGVVNSSNAGGTSSFGALLTCPGGLGGAIKQIGTGTTVSQSQQGGVGAVPSGSGIVWASQGNYGFPGMVYGAVNEAYGGQGGVSFLGRGAGNTSAVSNPGGGYGAGGSGSAAINTDAARAGGAGSSGICIIEEFA